MARLNDEIEAGGILNKLAKVAAAVRPKRKTAIEVKGGFRDKFGRYRSPHDIHCLEIMSRRGFRKGKSYKKVGQHGLILEVAFKGELAD